MVVKSNLVRVSVKNLSKKFNISSKMDRSALSKVISLATGRTGKREIEVLKGVTFEAREGEILGIIGKNGCGKSTLLAIIAGIYLSSDGELRTNGRVIYVPGLGQGLQQKLTMRENIFLMGSLMGLSQELIRKQFDTIVDFSGLREFLDTKVQQFSSGMISRLNFSITMNCIEYHNPEILLLDEVFGASADLDFQEKALKRMEQLISRGSTVILVSHAMDVIENYCDRAILLDKGKIVVEGNPAEVIKKYRESFKKLK